MENNREMRANTKKQENDSFGIKMVMAILAVAVVVLTLINAAPFSTKGEANAAVQENNVVVSRNAQVTHRADSRADIVEL